MDAHAKYTADITIIAVCKFLKTNEEAMEK